MCNPPFSVTSETIPGGLNATQFEYEDLHPADKDAFNCTLLNDYAVSIGCTDALYLMAHYSDFAVPKDVCTKCKQDDEGLSQSDKTVGSAHMQAHTTHHHNAVLFIALREQKRACQAATDVVHSKERQKLVDLTREQLFITRLQGHYESLLTDLRDRDSVLKYAAAAAWYYTFIPNTENLIKSIIKSFVLNPPKQRYHLFRGQIDSGKTTLAAAFLDFFGGVALNVNCSPDKLPFELGCAIDKFCCVFEDVKGTPTPQSNLEPGCGMLNIDNLRDHIDGKIKVNLERKHQNKINQLFPPGIITCNEYYIPKTVLNRMGGIHVFQHHPILKKACDKTPELQTRILTSGTLIAFILAYSCPVIDFVHEVQDLVVKVKEAIDMYISPTDFIHMKGLVTQGKDVLERWR